MLVVSPSSFLTVGKKKEFHCVTPSKKVVGQKREDTVSIPEASIVIVP